MTTARLRARQGLGGIVHLVRRHPSPGSLSILMYHAVTRDALFDAAQMSISRDQLRAHLAHLRALDVSFVSLADAAGALRSDGRSRALVAVAFDDGFVGVHDHAASLLVEFAIPATAFVVTAWVGQPAMPGNTPALGRPMTWPEVSALAASGIEIGSHTHSHPKLTAAPNAVVLDELERSSALIADGIGRRPRVFAYPYGTYGAFDERTRSLVAQAGLDTACTTVWGRNHAGADPLALRRLRLSGSDGARDLDKALSGAYDWYRIVQRAQALRSC